MEQEIWISPKIRRIHQLIRERIEARLVDDGITHIQMHVIRLLCESGGSMDQRKLTERMQIQPPTMNGILDRMEEKQLLERCACPGDGRKKRVQVTPQGREYDEKGRAAFLKLEEILRGDLSAEEWNQLQGTLELLIQHLEEDRHA